MSEGLNCYLLFDIKIEQMYSVGVPNNGPGKADVLQGTLDIMILQTSAVASVCGGLLTFVDFCRR